MASTDPIAIDKANLDLIRQTNEEGKKTNFWSKLIVYMVKILLLLLKNF